MGMEVSSADSAHGRVKGGIIQGDIVQPRQLEESIESCITDTPQETRNKPTSKYTKHSFYKECCILKLKEAENDLQLMNQKSYQLYLALNCKKDQCRRNEQSWALTWEDRQYEQSLHNKMRELKPPSHSALAKLHHPGNITREMEDLCSSEKELSCVMKRLSHCLKHKTNTSVNERQLLREMKLLEGTREEVVAKSSKTKSQCSFGPEKAIQDKLAGLGLGRARKQHQAIKEKKRLFEYERKLKGKEIQLLEKEYWTLNNKIAKTHKTVSQLGSSIWIS